MDSQVRCPVASPLIFERERKGKMLISMSILLPLQLPISLKIKRIYVNIGLLLDYKTSIVPWMAMCEQIGNISNSARKMSNIKRSVKNYGMLPYEETCRNGTSNFRDIKPLYFNFFNTSGNLRVRAKNDHRINENTVGILRINRF
mgnify:CR=1 FL=1